MKQARNILSSVVLVTVMSLVACEQRDAPPRPVGSATNKHVEETPATSPQNAAKAIAEAAKAPLDKAHEAEGTLQKAADATSKQPEQGGY
jgi:hypothetical protein